MKKPSRQNLRQIALDAFARRNKDCGDLIAEALKHSPTDGALLIIDAAFRAEQGEQRPFDRLEAVLDRDPAWVEGQRSLAQLKIVFGYAEPLSKLERAVALHGDNPSLWHCYLNLLSSMDRNAEAVKRTAELRRRIGNVPALCLLEARFAGLAGDPERGAKLLEGLPNTLPDLDYQKIRNALQRGALEEAVDLIEHAQLGNDMRLWAMAELCWRTSHDRRHDWLIGGGSLTQTFDLNLSETALLEVCETLRLLHKTKNAPPSQSLRNGTQTQGNLHLRDDPVIAQLFSAFEAALAHYTAELPVLGSRHPLFPIIEHPARVTASWSVRLTGGGFHIPHMHSEGLLSSACHLVVPESPDSEQGLLELGRPPIDIALELEPLCTFHAIPGRLVLFPSFLYHSTTSFSHGERLTAVFDAA